MKKRCPKCKTELDVLSFSKLRSAKDGLQSRCRACVRAYQQTPHAKEQERKARAKPSRKFAAWSMRLRTLYGITPERWLELFNAQNGVCPGCKRVLGRGIQTHVDHCHATGAVRGLLCRRCNLAIGHTNDDPVILFNLLQYLKGA